MKRLIQEDHLKKYVKNDSFHDSDKANLLVRDGIGSPRPNKAKEAFQSKGIKALRHMLKTITRGFAGGEETSSTRRRHTL